MLSTSSSANQLVASLGKWIGVFMRQSMGELALYARESGLSMSQVSALFRLYHTGACPISEIGAHLGVTNAAASQRPKPRQWRPRARRRRRGHGCGRGRNGRPTRTRRRCGSA